MDTPKWRNWQTRWTQNPVGLAPRAGSIPAFGICSRPDTILNTTPEHADDTDDRKLDGWRSELAS